MNQSLKRAFERLQEPTTLFWVVPLFLSLEYWLFGPSSLLVVTDGANDFIPRIQFLIHQWTKFGFSTYSWSTSGGYDFLSGIPDFLTLKFLLFSALPAWLGSALNQIFGYTAGLVGTYLLLKERLTGKAALATALLYVAWNTSAGYWLDFLYQPLLAYIFICGARAKTARMHYLVWPLAASILVKLVMMFASGVPFVVLGAVAIACIFVEVRKLFPVLAIFSACTFPLYLPELAAKLVLLPGSIRETTYAPISGLGAILIGSLGELLRIRDAEVLSPIILPFLILLLGVFQFKSFNKRLLGVGGIFLLASVICNFLKANTNVPLGPLNGFNLFRFGQAGHWLFFCAFAVGFVDLVQKRFGLQRVVPISLLLCFLYNSGVKVASSYRWIGGESDKILSTQIGPSLIGSFVEGDPFRTEFVDSAPDFAGFYGLETNGGGDNFMSRTHREIFNRIIQPGIKNYGGDLFKANMVGLFLPGKIPPLERYTNKRFSDFFDLDLMSFLNTKFLVSRFELLDSDLKLVHRATQPALFRFTQPNTWMNRFYQLFVQPDFLYVYENPNYLPRFFFVDYLERISDEAVLNQRWQTADIKKLRSNAFVFEFAEPGNVKYGKAAPAKVLNIQVGAGTVSIRIAAPQGGFLASTVNSHPWWHAYVGATQLKVVSAYGAFLGVEVPAGTEMVEFRFKNKILFNH